MVYYNYFVLQIDQDAFRESFINALHYTFMFGDANGNVDRVLQFIANFCTVIDDDEDFLHFVFGVIFDVIHFDDMLCST